MKRWWTATLFVLLVTAVVWLVVLARDGDFTPLRRVTVEGELRYLSRDRLQEKVVEHVEGGFFAIDLEAVRRAVEGLPWVEQVTVRRRWPDQLEVHVRERRAAARWGDGGLVDANGVLFHPPVEEDMAALPVLRGPAGSAGQLLAMLRRMNGWLLPLGVTATRLAAEQRGAVELMLASGPVLVLGRLSEEEVRGRLERALPVLLAEAERRGQALERVDMRYPNGMAVTWEPPPAAASGANQN